MTGEVATHLLEAIAANRLILLSGAGLSMAPPSNLPSAGSVAHHCAETYSTCMGTELDSALRTYPLYGFGGQVTTTTKEESAMEFHKLKPVHNWRGLLANAMVLLAACITFGVASGAQGQFTDTRPVPVTADNFVRAESDNYFAAIVKGVGLGKIHHNRELTSLDRQTVIRMNRDTLYSVMVVDLDAGPATISLPDPGSRYMSLQVINEDQYTLQVAYGAGSHTITRQEAGTRYAYAVIRTKVDPTDPRDMDQAHALQDAVKLTQKSPGSFEIPNWEQASLVRVRDALLTLGSTLPDSKKMFGLKGQVDPIRHLIGTATLWGGLPEADATYLNVTPSKNDGTVEYKLEIGEVPIDGFWSVSVYNQRGFFEPNKYNAYTVNSITAKKNADHSVSIQFGGCDGKISNCLPTPPGWNYTVRLYRPHAEILNGHWHFPMAQPLLRRSPLGSSTISQEMVVRRRTLPLRLA